MWDVLSKLVGNHVLWSVKQHTWDRTNIQEGLRHCRASLFSHRRGQIASRLSWSVSAVQIFIGNHSPTCFLQVSAHQQQKPFRHSELSLKAFFWLFGHIQLQPHKRVPRTHKTATVHTKQRIAPVSKIWQKEVFLWQLQPLSTGQSRGDSNALYRKQTH